MRKFDTNVQHLKYKVLREVARAAWDNTLLEVVNDIPNIIVAGKEATMRCCVYKERAIAARRVKMAMGGNRANHNVIEVINIACDECPVAGYEVTNSCRGCIAHYCKDVCKRNAIVFDRKTKAAYIDKEKCAECGMCEKVCPYSAIVNFKRPCEKTCKVKAITVETQGGDTPSGNRECKIACIDNEKCIACGACVYQCPFGAIMDKSFILDVIDIILKSENNTKYKVFAVAAPSIGSQFSYAKPGQVITGLKEIGFEQVAEAALGADMVAYKESQELYEKAEEIKYITSSCCPAFVDYIKKQFPELVPHISHNLSPMAEIAKHIKKKDPTAKIIFIGPCTAKKAEMKTAEV
jgi:[FeFe] hydrogenase (group B1/B3)